MIATLLPLLAGGALASGGDAAVRAGPRLALERACVYAGTYGQDETFATTLIVRNQGDGTHAR